MKTPKILLFDIETSPIIFYGWGLYQEPTHPKFIRRNWFVLCWAAKWLGEKKIYSAALPDFRGYKELPSKTEKSIDGKIMRILRDLLDECDIAVAQNLKGFDKKKANTRFIINGIKPPSPYQEVDTLTVARTQFKFTSNKLEYLSSKLCVTPKMDSGGFDLWRGCEDGDKKSWNKMVRYCRQDVRSLEDVYNEFLPYIKALNQSRFRRDVCCPKCGSKNYQSRGIDWSRATPNRRYSCNECFSWFRANLTKQDRVDYKDKLKARTSK